MCGDGAGMGTNVRGAVGCKTLTRMPADDVTSCPPAAARFSEQESPVWKPEGHAHRAVNSHNSLQTVL